jgi:hypothetical protein
MLLQMGQAPQQSLCAIATTTGGESSSISGIVNLISTVLPTLELLKPALTVTVSTVLLVIVAVQMGQAPQQSLCKLRMLTAIT